MSTSNQKQFELVKALKNKRAYPHAVNSLEIIETHISWIILTGIYAYKIKKACNLGFYNGLELKDRLFLCEEELRLNRRLNPDLYIEINTKN